MYHYKAIVTKVYSGDTIAADLDLGFGYWHRGQKFKLDGIDVPSTRGVEREKGLESRDYLRELILGKEVTIETIKDKKGKDGDWLAEVFIIDEEDMVKWVTILMVKSGHATKRDR